MKHDYKYYDAYHNFLERGFNSGFGFLFAMGFLVLAVPLVILGLLKI